MKRFVCFHEQNSIFNAWGYCLDTQLINGSTNIVMLTEPESSAIHIVGFLCGIQLKETFNALLCFPFPSVCHKGSCACKKKKKKLERSEHQQKLLSPTENTAPEHLINSPVFKAVILWHHTTSPRRTFAAILARENWFCWVRHVWVDQSEQREEQLSNKVDSMKKWMCFVWAVSPLKLHYVTKVMKMTSLHLWLSVSQTTMFHWT